MVCNGSLGWRRAFVVVGLSLSAAFVAMPATVAFAATEEAPVTAQASSEFPYSYADGLAGFLRYLGDGTSANMLGSDLPGIEGDAAKQYYSNALNNIGSTMSALNLDSVKEAIDILEECNSLRRAAGLNELKVNTKLMALSAISATYAANYPKISDPHQVASDNGVGEILLTWEFKAQFNEYYNKVQAERTFTITVLNVSHGELSISNPDAKVGEQVDVTLVPEQGYEVERLYAVDASGKQITTNKNSVSNGSVTIGFAMPASDVKIVATTKQQQDESALPITVGAAEGVKVTCPATAELGETVSVTLAAEDGYEVKGAAARGADGKAVALTRKGDTWSFTMPDTPVSITPQVEKKTYSVTAAQAAGAKVTLGREDAQVGDTVSVTVQPEEGKRVAKVYIVDESGRETMATASGNRWSFKMPASSVSVRVELVDEDEALPVDFPDIHEGDWYYEPVVWAVESGAMSGYGNGDFGPLGTLTRGQVATILHNLAGKPAADGSAVGEDFSDCSPEDFYAEAVAWAVDEGIFSGYNNGTFGPSAPMSREQLCVVLWRMQGEPKGTADLSAFPDGSKTSTFAKDAVSWAVEEGLLKGNAQGELNPTGDLNRAEGATILMRYSEMFG